MFIYSKEMVSVNGHVTLFRNSSVGGVGSLKNNVDREISIIKCVSYRFFTKFVNNLNITNLIFMSSIEVKLVPRSHI